MQVSVLLKYPRDLIHKLFKSTWLFRKANGVNSALLAEGSNQEIAPPSHRSSTLHTSSSKLRLMSIQKCSSENPPLLGNSRLRMSVQNLTVLERPLHSRSMKDLPSLCLQKKVIKVFKIPPIMSRI